MAATGARDGRCYNPTAMLSGASLLCLRRTKPISYPVMRRSYPCSPIHTTRSWDFLRLPDWALGAATRHRRHHHKHRSSDVIIGIIDTGIWPESPSFNDRGMGKIPSKWKGICEESSDFNRTNCNRKLIGARVYNDDNATQASLSPRDFSGHGTHTASTAGGARVPNANYYGLAKGTARGGYPAARIASYRACHEEGCTGSAMLKAFDDAIGDGVDIISVSIGPNSEPDFRRDPTAIGAFHAAQKGVMVVASAGNSGPEAGTVVNSAPWLFTVAASTTDRTFHSKIILGNGKTFEGTAINFSPLKPDERFPVALGESVADESATPSDARNCFPGALDPKKARGKIIVCMNEDTSISRSIKRLVVEDSGAKGMILVQGRVLIIPTDSGTYPFSEVDENAGAQILKYINSTKNPSATILATRDVKGFKPAPVVATFSSRGPGTLTENILKPDVMAPGVAILAAFVPIVPTDYSAPGNKSSTFALRSGTSMACPHVSGAAAFVKSLRPRWSSSLIKSALITTASIGNNLGKIVTNTSYSATNPHESGAGEISPMKALDPGLGFETSINDHFRFLCYYGYTQKQIRLMTSTKFICPKSSSKELISSINYPTISIAALQGKMKVKRVVTNVGSPNSTYVATVNSPPDLGVRVYPRKLVFGQGVKKASFRVVFDAKRASKGYKYGDVSWCDGSNLVRLVFAVNVE